jgi:hypothetical protein
MYLVTETSPLFHLNCSDLATCPTIKLKKWKSWFVGIEVTVINFVMIDNDLCDVSAVFGKRVGLEKIEIFKTAISSFEFDVQSKLTFLRGQFIILYFR